MGAENNQTTVARKSILPMKTEGREEKLKVKNDIHNNSANRNDEDKNGKTTHLVSNGENSCTKRLVLTQVPSISNFDQGNLGFTKCAFRTDIYRREKIE